MLKEPRRGRVKTRLAQQIGAGAALRFYRANVMATITRLRRDPRWRLVLAVAPDASIASRAWPAGVPRVAQGGGDLGARMERLFAKAHPGPALIIGGDIPGITARDIAHALDRLKRQDVVLGPAADGGFWLIAARRGVRFGGRLAGVRWSGPHAMGDTLWRCAELRVGFAATRRDVDGAEDYAATGASNCRLLRGAPWPADNSR
jgi:rSAM/selenodomain-associated transferase 1